MKKNDILKLKITDVSIDGSGIGRNDGMAVFVPCSAVGDELEVRVVKVKKNYAFGKIEKVISPGYGRIRSDCTAYPKCGGCAFRHVSYDAELQIKEKYVKDCITRIGGFENINVEKIIGAEKTEKYRNKMQIPVKRDSKGETITGFYRFHSHDIVKCDECKLNPELFQKIVCEIKDWMTEYGIEPYDETNFSGIVRHIYLRQAEVGKEVVVCIVINSDNLNFKDELVKRLVNKYNNIVGIVLNINKNNTNVVLGEKDKVIYGRNYINDTLCGVKLQISTKAFYQVNHKQTEILYETVKKILNLTGKEKILEFYCGIGSIGLFLAKSVSSVVGIEIVRDAIENAKINSKINNLENIEFICGDSNKKFEEGWDKLKNSDIIIIDPPRKGCENELIHKISDVNPNKVVYVSCNPSTLARDLKEFGNLGFEIKIVIPVDMFPRSAHVETIVLLYRHK